MTEVHALAGELGVSTAVIRQVVAELTGAAAPEYTLAPELADQVRAKLRSAQRSAQSPGGNPMFSGPATGSTAVRPTSGPVGPAFAGQAERRPAQGPRGGAGFSQAGGADYASSLAAQLAEQKATTADHAQWRAAGLGAHDGHLIELCQRHGLVPEDLRRRVDGQTVASRLKNGESMSSVRSRMS